MAANPSAFSIADVTMLPTAQAIEGINGAGGDAVHPAPLEVHAVVPLMEDPPAAIKSLMLPTFKFGGEAAKIVWH